MTADVIKIGRIAFGPRASDEPERSLPAAVLHYTDQAKLAWFDRLVNTLADAERVFSQLSSADDEVECLERMREVLEGVKGL